MLNLFFSVMDEVCFKYGLDDVAFITQFVSYTKKSDFYQKFQFLLGKKGYRYLLNGIEMK